MKVYDGVCVNWERGTMQRVTYLAIPLLFTTALAQAQGVFTDGDALLLQTSLWTHHYNDEPDHNNEQRLVNAEWYFPDTLLKLNKGDWRDEIRWLAGGATFKNSYDQQSTYLYGGGRYDYPLGENTDAYLKLTAGLLHGYRGEYKDKIPFNELGVAPVILPAVGMTYRRLNVEIVPFAAAGVMMNIGVYLR